jgi:predicted ATP-grasp superfamily ATP-dependent carboligase
VRIFAYEHITGGGMLDEPQVAPLAPEGEMMLRALVDDLTAIPGVEVTVMRDFRLKADLPARTLVVQAGQFDAVFRQAMQECDAVWPIAPEQDGILSRITHEMLACGRTLLGNRPDAIVIAASKRATAATLAQAGIAVVPVYSSERGLPRDISEIVVKPDDGAGCQDTLLFGDRANLRGWLREHASSKQIFQPYIRGEARSLSVLCCDGRARLLACNRQKVELENGAFRFEGVSVNAVADRDGRYAVLANAIARTLHGLWGYCGVDFIETDTGPIVVEVNPRLTTSYAGLHRATGINPAQLVLELPGSLEAVEGMRHRTRAVEVEVAHAG